MWYCRRYEACVPDLESRKEMATNDRECDIMVNGEYGARKVMGFDLFLLFLPFSLPF